MTDTPLFANFAETVLEEAVTVGATTFKIAVGDTGKFPSPGAGEYFALTVWDGTNLPEIVYCTSNPLTGSLTVVRGRESTGTVAWEAGAKLRLIATAAVFDSLADITSAANIALSPNVLEEGFVQGAMEALESRLPSGWGTVGGTGDAITVTHTPAWPALVPGQLLIFKAAATNTGAVTVDVDGLGAKPMVKRDGSAMSVDDIKVNTGVIAVYDGTSYIHMSFRPIKSGDITDGQVGTAALASNAVTMTKIADSNVTSAKIASSAVTTAKIADGAVTGAKFADGTVTSAKVADANITTAKIADAAVTLAKIAVGTIGDILYAGASGVWAMLGAGTAGKFLRTNGAGVAPSWAYPEKMQGPNATTVVEGVNSTGTDVLQLMGGAKIKQFLYAEKVWDIPSTAAGVTNYTDVTVSGVKLAEDNVVIVTAYTDGAAASLTRGLVTADNVVTLYFWNWTASTINPVSSTFKVLVMSLEA